MLHLSSASSIYCVYIPRQKLTHSYTSCRALRSLDRSVNSSASAFCHPLRRRNSLRTTTLVQLAGEASDRPISKDVERSKLVNQELILLIFQMDLDQQLQRALNYENYDAAQDIRQRRTAVDEAISELQERKGSFRAKRAEITDITTEGLRLRSELQRAVEEERYKEAAQIRDRLKEFEQQAGAAAAVAAEWGEGSRVQLRLGQRVKHKKYGYRGVICGWDAMCCEGEEWQQEVQVGQLSRGASQPFYHVLVDTRDWMVDAEQAPVAYVAEELLEAPQSSWVEEHGKDSFQHPYTYLMFYGTGGNGDLIPVKQLRDKYNKPRVDSYVPSNNKETPGDENGSGDKN